MELPANELWMPFWMSVMIEAERWSQAARELTKSELRRPHTVLMAVELSMSSTMEGLGSGWDSRSGILPAGCARKKELSTLGGGRRDGLMGG